MKNKKMKLAVFIHNSGAHPGGWRYAADGPADLHDVKFYARIAQTAERGKFHVFFAGDAQGYHHIPGRDAFAATDNSGKLEPTTLLGALAMVTEHIGLIATASTTYNEPYALARRFASLDHITGGRAGWNVVTSTTDSEARNFGRQSNVAHDDRYARAEEFVDVVKGLWDSWEDDALLKDVAAGRYFNPDKVHALAHQGRFFSVEGPLNVCRPPQGHPVIVQAGGSEPGMQLSARTADMVFTAQSSKARAQAFYADMKQRIAAFGRDASSVAILPSCQLMVRSTEAEARRAERDLLERIPLELAVARLEMLLGGIDLSSYPLNGPLPDSIALTNGGQSVQRQILAMASEENLSIEQLARRVSISRASWSLAGSPEQIADMCEDWFRDGACDGFALAPNTLPDCLDNFVEHVVPILQKRGLFRTEYEGATLRENLGLPRPANIFVRHPERHREPSIWAR
ncbi:MAG TPA: LLM class flavin-dependent oxidoreductase [Pedomonas sp.]|uniref:LLM class flavin-dependent oxidoreductase n=1 Tax=Pedomonas sp. TaxID=2976421 RepID=UPI002F3FA043